MEPDSLLIEFQAFYFFHVCMNSLIYTTGPFNPGEIGNFLYDDLPKKEHYSSSEGYLTYLHTSAYLPDSIFF